MLKNEHYFHSLYVNTFDPCCGKRRIRAPKVSVKGFTRNLHSIKDRMLLIALSLLSAPALKSFILHELTILSLLLFKIQAVKLTQAA